MTANYVFSPSKNAMYDVSIKSSYESAGSWPTDGVEVTDEIYQMYSQDAPDGKVRGVKDNGPAWVDTPPLTDEENVAEAEGVKQSLLQEATQKITVWQTKLLMGRKLTDSETASLNTWMDYIDSVSAVDTSKAPAEEWPEQPE